VRDADPLMALETVTDDVPRETTEALAREIPAPEKVQALVPTVVVTKFIPVMDCAEPNVMLVLAFDAA
jgi:hypothetical protein